MLLVQPQAHLGMAPYMRYPDSPLGGIKSE